jgi:Uma2 family endonuclease
MRLALAAEEGHDRAMDQALNHARMTEEEFLALPESKEHLELIDGEVIHMPGPVVHHQVIVGNLYVHLRAWANAHPPAWVGLSPCDVRLQTGRIVQPDLFILVDGLPSLGKLIDRPPDLVVEVMSSWRSYDRLTKRMLYGQAGVREYWIVDPEERAIELVHGIETLENARERLTSRLLSDLAVEVPAIFHVGG